MNFNTGATVRFCMTIGLALLGMVFATPANAHPGDLESSFGQGGLTEVRTGNPADRFAIDSALQADGRILVLDRSVPDGLSELSRYLPDGRIDRSFGSGGTIRSGDTFWTAVTSRADGRILLAGRDDRKLTVSRFDADGSADPAFGTGGTAELDPLPLLSQYAIGQGVKPDLFEIRALDDGMIMAGGSITDCYDDDEWSVEDPSCPGLIAVRLTADGDPDPGFADGTGMLAPGLPNYNATVGLLADGSYLMLGGGSIDSGDGGIDSILGVAMIGPDGHREDSFEPGLPDYSPDHSHGAVTVDHAGRIVVSVGHTVFRLSRAGRIDPSFSGNGAIDLNDDTFWDSGAVSVGGIGVDHKNRILLSGGASKHPRSSGFAARLNVDGSPDPTFANDGIRLVWAGTRTAFPVEPAGLLALPDGSVRIVGTREHHGTYSSVIAGLEGGNGPTFTCQGKPATFIGTPGADHIKRNFFGVAVTLGGNDRIDEASRATICTGAGNDRVSSFWGDNRINLGPGRDIVRAKRKNYGVGDLIRGGKGKDRVLGGSGRDRILGGPGDDVLFGGIHNDRIWGGPGRDRLFGGKGWDHLFGGRGRDLLRTGQSGPHRRIYREGTQDKRITFYRKGRLITKIRYWPKLSCGSAGEHYDSHLKVPIRRDHGVDRFRYRQNINSDFFTSLTVVKGRDTGRALVGRYKDLEDPDCWTGESKQEPWVKFRARILPRERDTAKQ